MGRGDGDEDDPHRRRQPDERHRSAVPFALVKEEFRAAHLVFSNLECCLCEAPPGHSRDNEGFFADPLVAGEALRSAGIQAVGIANNVNYGEAAITASLTKLTQLGIEHTGAGANQMAARAPAIIERDGVRFGFLQRSSVYWPTNHEAGDNSVGIAVIRGHTAYQIPMHGGRPRANRPGLPPQIISTSSGSPRTSSRFARRPTSSSPRAIGG
jgi:capsule synthesis protein PGA_cap